MSILSNERVQRHCRYADNEPVLLNDTLSIDNDMIIIYQTQKANLSNVFLVNGICYHMQSYLSDSVPLDCI